MICIARTFGAPDRVPAGSIAAQRVEGGDSFTEPTGDARDDVHHVAVVLDDHESSTLTPAVLAYAADVVAAEVDEHHVLGALLGIGEQPLGVLCVLLDGCSRGRVPATGRVATRRP